MVEHTDPEDWGGYKRMILKQLDELQTSLGVIRTEIQNFRQKEISDIKVEIALLKLKSSLWGALLGSIGGALVAGIAVLGKFLGGS